MVALVPPVGGVLSQRFVPPGKDAATATAQGQRGQVVWTAPQGSLVLATAGVMLLLLAAGIWRSLATVAKPQSAL